MNPTATDLDEFSPKTVHRLVSDLMRPRILVYWLDFLLSLVVGVLAFAAIPILEYSPLPSAVSFIISVIALYRAMTFIHEIVHFRSRRQFRRFRVGWNLLCGIPMFMPIFMYECHVEHHSQRWYGTSHDAEYLPLATMDSGTIVGLLSVVPLLPLLGPLRFGLLTPISWFVAGLRRFVYENLSALKIDVDYKGRPPANPAERRSWMIQEAGCLVVFWAVVAGVTVGLIPWPLVVLWYVTYAGIVGLDTVRVLGAHRYLGDEDSMSVVEQMLDTYNYPRRRAITELWAPVGLRLHALHHLLPGLPYHAYQAAHLRLVDQLPADSPYRTTESPGLYWSLKTLWQSSSAASVPSIRGSSARVDSRR